MAIVKVQSITGNGATLVLNGVAAGNALVLITSYTRATTGATETTPSDSNGTFTAARNDVPVVFNTSDDVGATIWFQPNAAAGTHTVTPQANVSHHHSLMEFSGMATSGLLDATVAAQKNNAGNQSSQATGTTGATVQASELSLIAFSIASGGGSAIVQTDPIPNYLTVSIGNDTVNDFGFVHAYQILSAIGTQSATDNWTNQATPEASIGSIATFKAASGAPVGGFVAPVPLW